MTATTTVPRHSTAGTAGSTSQPNGTAPPPARRGWRSRRDDLRARAATTPGRLSLALILCVVCCVALGAIGVWTAESHAGAAHAVRDSSERLTVEAQQIYQDLADADTTAAGGFLSGGVEPASIRQRYLTDIAQAQRALLDATELIGTDSAAARSLNTLTAGVPTYTGLIETARADNLQGLPVGAAYLREASAFMRASLLPAADQLFELESQRLDSEQDDASSFPYIALLVALLVLAVFIAVARGLWLRTHRVLNLGIVGAIAATLVSLLWTQVAIGSQSSDIETGKSQGSAQLQILAQARIAAIRARGDEALILVGRGSDPAPQTDLTAATTALRQDLTNAAKLPTGASGQVAAAARALTTWQTANQRFIAQSTAGDYTAAVAGVLRPTKGSVASAFAAVDDSLAMAITTDQAAFTHDAGAAVGDLDLTTPAAVVLALLALTGCVLGIGARLREYR